jgi:hypothetical protein
MKGCANSYNRSFTHLFWIDGDIGFTPETAFPLLQADKDVIAGAYPVKQIHWPAVLPAVSPADFMLATCATRSMLRTNRGRWT